MLRGPGWDRIRDAPDKRVNPKTIWALIVWFKQDCSPLSGPAKELREFLTEPGHPV
jgi:hypothetical protein